MVTGCANILDKVTKKQQDATKPTVTTKVGAQTQPQEFTLKELQVALKDSKTVKLVAQDTGQSLVLDDAKRKELIRFLADAGELKESKELALAVASPEFPAYQVQLDGDKSLKLDIYDSLRLGSGTENARHYYMEKGEVWKNLNKWLPPIAYKETSLGYLFKASKVTVKGGTFSEETDVSYARNAILRTIRTVQMQSSTLPQEAGEALSISFLVNGKKYAIQVYDQHLKYLNATYKFSPGKQAIENMLSPG